MPAIPILPPNHFPVGSAAYNGNTDRFINNQEAGGNIDSDQAQTLGDQQQQIHEQRQADLAKGIDPRTDVNLRQAQMTIVLPNGEQVTKNATAANGGPSSVTITGPYGQRQETIDANGVRSGPAQPIDRGTVYTP